MQYKIIVDKQPSSNPSSEKKEYIVDIEELRVKDDVYDSLNIEMDKTYVTRRLKLSEYGVLSVLDEPVIQQLTDINIELFEGDNYIYLSDMQGNNIYAEYLVKNDFTDTYVTTNQMNSTIKQTAQIIEFSVNQKLEGYSTTEEMNSAIKVSADNITSTVSKSYATKNELSTAKSEIKQTTDSITSEVNKKVGEAELGTKIQQNAEAVKIAWNKFSQYIQMQILNGNASIVIKDNSNNVLMSLDKTGQHFYSSNSQIANIGLSTRNNVKYVSFGVAGKSGQTTNVGFAWGINTAESGFLPVFWMDNYYYVANSGVMTGKFTIAGILDVVGKMGVNGGFYINGDIGVFFVEGSNERRYFEVYSDEYGSGGGFCFYKGNGEALLQGYKSSDSNTFFINFKNNDAIDIRNCRAENFIGPSVLNESRKELKKNIKEFDRSALDIIKNSNIYEYELKAENNGRKHYGFVIDEENLDVPKEIMSENKIGIDLYALGSLDWKGIQELIEKQEKSEKRIEELENKIIKLENIIAKLSDKLEGEQSNE